MTDTNQNVKVYRGDSASLPITVTMADGSPFDPTIEVDIRWRMSRTWYSDESEALIRKSLNNGIVAGESGVVITLDPEDTDLPPAVYYHELKVKDATGKDVATATVGAFIIKRAAKMRDLTTALGLKTYAPGVAHG